ncbi:hypothetical protein FB567DRAFT_594305 [Paraphoma chrysanthemicola]|uniref:Uncharacterized protein n=1 Tax=Paraphoma chrysanthemicola TaxID=798071 RepID=A0A8K0R4K9_9PLEO|nr:hypothetical protein FB567DRAFT_594305 [Paraphoma chrysanthemicola]
MTTFQQLSQGIRREILRYLLLADRVRQPPNHYLVEHYVFEVNILRVNRSLNEDGKIILYRDNRFVKVNSVFANFKMSPEEEKTMEDAMTNHEVPFFRIKDDFNYHVAEITTKPHDMNQRRLAAGPKKSFLLLSQDISKYTRLLRLMDLANFMGLCIDFKLRHHPLMTAPLSVSEQESLLAPFERVRGTAFRQEVRFSGDVDPQIEAKVKQAMTQQIAWLRGGAWEIHDMALSIKQDTQNFLESAMKLSTMMKGIDNNFSTAIGVLECTTLVDIALLLLSDMTMKEVGKRCYQGVLNFEPRIKDAESLPADHKPIISAEVTARFYHLLGIAELGLNHPIKAGKAFAKSYRLAATADTKVGYETAKAWKSLSQQAKESGLQRVLYNMPGTPFTIPNMKEYSTPEVASEIWLMRELGLKGPIPYENKIKPALAVVLTSKPHPKHHNQGPRTAQVGMVKPEVLRKQVEKYRKNMAHPLAKGRMIGWVRLGADEIGEETVLDDPGFVEAMKNMGRNGCNPQ